METGAQTAARAGDPRVRLSTLWIVVLFNMVFADICSFMLPEFLGAVVNGTTPVKITQPFMLAMAAVLQIPILMIYLSRTLGRSANRKANMAAAVLTFAFVIAGGSTYLHYLLFAAVEVACLLLIFRKAQAWTRDAG